MKMAAAQSPARRSRELGVPLLGAPSEKSAQPPLPPWPPVAPGGKQSIAGTWRNAPRFFCLRGLQLRSEPTQPATGTR